MSEAPRKINRLNDAKRLAVMDWCRSHVDILAGGKHTIPELCAIVSREVGCTVSPGPLRHLAEISCHQAIVSRQVARGISAVGGPTKWANMMEATTAISATLSALLVREEQLLAYMARTPSTNATDNATLRALIASNSQAQMVMAGLAWPPKD
jgi:hypothetical protein